eukprot:c6576_g1_i1 orf=23-316(+)
MVRLVMEGVLQGSLASKRPQLFMEGAFQGILPNQRQWEQEWPEVLQLKEKTNKGIKEKLTRSREEDEDVRKVTCEEYQDRTALLDLIKACGKHKDLR